MSSESGRSSTSALRLGDVQSWDIQTDVAIVGFGAAGVCAAIEARSAGATVHVFEVAGGPGGCAALSGGEVYLGGNGGTPIQRAAGFEDSTEDLYQYLLMNGGPGADEAKTRLYANRALEHFEWLVAQGVPFKGTYLPGKWLEPLTDDTLVWSGNEDAWPCIQRAKPAPRGHAPSQEGWGAGRLLMDQLAKRAIDLGVNVQYNSRALRLIARADGSVAGLVVRMDGRECNVRARRGVILCAGGFACNESMIRQYTPGALACKTPITAGND